MCKVIHLFVSDTQEDNVVMFTTSQSSLYLPGWRGGDLQFVFRTTEQTAVLLFQPSFTTDCQLLFMLRGGRCDHVDIFMETSQTQIVSLLSGVFVINVISVVFAGIFLHFKMKHLAIEETVQLKSRLNTGRVQLISVEFAQKQARLRVNGESFFFDVNSASRLGDKANQLYVASNVR